MKPFTFGCFVLVLTVLTSSEGDFSNSRSRKILCLHGGGGTADDFRMELGGLMNALPEFDFVFANSGYNGLWIRDPPGGKNQPTTDPHFADASLQSLDQIVAEQGPFYGILGYSQGSAFIPVYLAHAPIGTFQVAMMFCGYLTTTHQGLLDTVYAASPFGDITALVWMGALDQIIGNAMTMEQAGVFTDPTVITSQTGGHEVPGTKSTTDPDLDDVTAWIRSHNSGVVQTTSLTNLATTQPVSTLQPSQTASCATDFCVGDLVSAYEKTYCIESILMNRYTVSESGTSESFEWDSSWGSFTLASAQGCATESSTTQSITSTSTTSLTEGGTSSPSGCGTEFCVGDSVSAAGKTFCVQAFDSGSSQYTVIELGTADAFQWDSTWGGLSLVALQGCSDSVDETSSTSLSPVSTSAVGSTSEIVSTQTQSGSQKILCLHGGGGSPSGMRAGISDLMNALPEFEFVFATSGYNGLWIRDPPGGKNQPTTDPHFADASLQSLDQIVAEEGPFFGILGYSQGSAFVPVYLAHAPVGTFQVAMMFCGYLTTTHQGLLNNVYAASPFGDITALVWMGAQDFVITNAMTTEQAGVFTAPAVITSQAGGHAVPGDYDATFTEVTAWIRGNSGSTQSTSTTMRVSTTIRSTSSTPQAVTTSGPTQPNGCSTAFCVGDSVAAHGKTYCVESTSQGSYTVSEIGSAEGSFQWDSSWGPFTIVATQGCASETTGSNFPTMSPSVADMNYSVPPTVAPTFVSKLPSKAPTSIGDFDCLSLRRRRHQVRCLSDQVRSLRAKLNENEQALSACQDVYNDIEGLLNCNHCN